MSRFDDDDGDDDDDDDDDERCVSNVHHMSPDRTLSPGTDRKFVDHFPITNGPT